MDPENTDSQVQQTAAEMPGSDVQADGQGPKDGSQQHQGFQERINDLTRKWRDTERKLEQERIESQAKIDQLLAIASRQQAPVVPEAPLDIDPEEQKKLDAYFKRNVEPKLKAQADENASLRQLLAQQQAQAAVANMDPRVVQRADWLMKNSQYGALVRNGTATYEDVVKYAFGEIAMQDAQNKGRTRNERGQFNTAAGNTMMGQSPIAPPPQGQGDLPKNFDSLSPDQQAAILEKRLDGRTF